METPRQKIEADSDGLKHPCYISDSMNWLDGLSTMLNNYQWI